VATVNVQWFNAAKGHGFIAPDGGGGKDVFVFQPLRRLA
jgi:cold shock CspA family protein